jgi:polyisoprenoid-binding protein YceI
MAGSAFVLRQEWGFVMATWQIDGSHSAVEFSVKHMMVSRTKGRFTKFEGQIELDEHDLANSSVAVVIDAASLDTHDEKRDEHLRSAEFFDVANYPNITFTSTKVVPKSGDRFEVVGDLTIKGVTQQVAVNVEANGIGTSPWGQQVAGYEASTAINRKDFGLTWNVALETGGFLVGDEIKINLDIETVKQAAQVAA